MTKIGYRLRKIADECDSIPELTGLIFAISGDLEIHLGCADKRLSDREALEGLVASANNAIGRQSIELVRAYQAHAKSEMLQ